MYRPEGLVNPYADKDGCWEHQCFERGISATLEALMREGVYDIIKFTDDAVIIQLKDIVNQTYKRGTWVFIPEEE